MATSYSYDALNRLTDIAYPDAALNVHFSYDAQGCASAASAGCAGAADLAAGACAAGEQSAVGRVSGFTDASGNTALCYDPLGRLTRKQQTTAGIALTTTYAYAANGRLSQMTTPGGMIVSYGYDGAGRINAIDSQLPSEPSASALIGAVRYLPFGPIDRLTFGNGRIQTRSYDANYAIDQVSSTGANGLSLDFAVDAVGNLTQVTSGAAGNLLAYDGVDRLTEVKQLNNDLIEAFAYDATGNRTAHTDSAGITPYSYTAGSHRLSAVGATTRSVDAAGNTTAIGGTAFSYDARNRMSAATVAGQSTQYQYNARGERVSKAGTANTIFVYDEAGHLLGEYASDGSVRAEYVWLGDLPVAVRNANNTLAYMEPDHLGTPRSVIDPVRDVAIWQWPLLGNAFGDAAPVTDLDGDGVAFAMNLRFPGQYFDAETGLHYNYYRNYDPVTGRYVESDPIGLGGGDSTYTYVSSRPYNTIDYFGLQETTVTAWCRQNAAACAAMGGAAGLGATSSLPKIDVGSGSECRDECGPYNRMQAYIKALAHLGIGFINDWIVIPWNQYGGRFGPNAAFVRQNGSNSYGYWDPAPGSKARIENHPDGHPHQIGPDFPDHHRCPHYHVHDGSGNEDIFQYRRGT